MSDAFNEWWNEFAVQFSNQSLEFERNVAYAAFMAGCDASTEEFLLKKITFTKDEHGFISGFKKE